MIQLYHKIIHYGYEITFSEEIKGNNNKIKQSKDQHNLDIQSTKISALSSGYVGKCEFFDRWRCFSRAKNSSLLNKELKPQTVIVEKKYQGLNKVY